MQFQIHHSHRIQQFLDDPFARSNEAPKGLKIFFEISIPLCWFYTLGEANLASIVVQVYSPPFSFLESSHGVREGRVGGGGGGGRGEKERKEKGGGRVSIFPISSSFNEVSVCSVV